MKLKMMMAIIAYLTTNCVSAQNKGYTISGNVKNLPDDVTFYLILNRESGGADTISRTKSKDQQFTFKGNLPEEGRLAFVKMDTSVVKIVNQNEPFKKRQSWVRLLLDNSDSDIKLKGDVKAWPKIDVEGSSLTKQHDRFIASVKIPMDQYNDKIDAAQRDSIKIAEAKQVYNSTYLKNLEQIQGSYAVPLFLYNNQMISLELREIAYQDLSDKLKKSYYGRLLARQIAGLKASKTIGIGKIIPDFQIKTPEGKLKSVRQLAMKSRYTLIDFWAWWCSPCRADIPNLKKVYGAFQDKGFNIISISTDPNDAKWRQALKEESTPWTNGIQQGNPSSNIFGLVSIPAYILLNEKVEIVKMDLNSKFFSRSVGTMNGSPVFLKDSKKKGLRGDDLYEVIEGLLGKPEIK